MLQRVLILTTCLGIGLCVFNQAALAQVGGERLALNHLKKDRYLRARLLLDRALRKDSANAVAHFVYVQYFFSPRNPAYHIDSALFHCNKSLQLLSTSTERQREKYRRFSLDSAALLHWRMRIDSAAFDRATRLNTESGYQFFIDHYPHAEQRDRAVELRDEVAFLNALRENTFQAFARYLEKYPQSHRSAEARTRYELLLFETKTRERKLTAYEQFIAEFPDSPHRAEAERQVLELRTASGDPHEFIRFIRTYPRSIHVPMARNLLYHILRENDARFPEELLTDSLRYMQSLESDRLFFVFKDGLTGWMNAEGKEIVTPFILNAEPGLHCSAFTADILLGDGKIINRNGTILAKEIDRFEDLGYGFLLVFRQSCGFVLHKSGLHIPASCARGARILGGALLAVQHRNGWDILTFTGRKLFSSVQDCADYYPVVGIRREGNWELMHVDQMRQIAEGGSPSRVIRADEVRRLTDALWLRRGNEQALADCSLQIRIPFTARQILPTFFGAMLKDNNHYQLWQPEKPMSIPYADVRMQDPWIAARSASGWHLFYKQVVIPSIGMCDTLFFAGPIAVARRADSTYVFFSVQQYVGFSGSPALQFIPGKDSLYFLRVDLPGGRAVFDAAGKRLFVTDAELLSYAGENYFVAVRNNKRGLLSVSGTWVIPAEYDAIGVVSQGLVAVLRNNKFGVWNLALRREIKPEYDKNLQPLPGNRLIATRKAATGIITWDNKPVLPFAYDEILPWADSVVLVKKNFQWLLLDLNTQRPIMDRIQSFSWIHRDEEEKVMLIRREGYYGVISSRRGIVLYPSYSAIYNLSTDTEPFYLTEKHVEEAGIFVLIYYNHAGKLIRRQVVEEEEYESLRCGKREEP
jgi:tetratricopeptide (TPR) repeat protein